jgi:hypothetical protein
LIVLENVFRITPQLQADNRIGHQATVRPACKQEFLQNGEFVMETTELSHAAALIAAAFVARKDAETPEEAARIYFRCLDAIVAAVQVREAERQEGERQDRQPKPWATPKKTVD